MLALIVPHRAVDVMLRKSQKIYKCMQLEKASNYEAKGWDALVHVF